MPKNPIAAFSYQVANRLNGLDKPTVWHEFSPLSHEFGSVNLGQGFPDWNPPAFAIEAMNKAIDPSSGRNANQYARSYAHMPLAQVLANDYSERFDRVIDPLTQVATAVGCTNALYCALQGMINDGDEVLLLEPAFDVYIAQTKMAGGKCKFIPLRSKSSDNNSEKSANEFFNLDMDELENAITDKTKAFILNTPHNPTGKMFTKEEMEKIAEVMKRHPQVVIIADEVYEHIVFDEETSPHISFATIDGMFDRTLTLSSSGKTFSNTGWKIGWVSRDIFMKYLRFCLFLILYGLLLTIVKGYRATRTCAFGYCCSTVDQLQRTNSKSRCNCSMSCQGKRAIRRI